MRTGITGATPRPRSTPPRSAGRSRPATPSGRSQRRPWHRPGTPDDRRVIGYWWRLVEANRGRLLDPGNPDLLVPGQELVLPDPQG